LRGKELRAQAGRSRLGFGEEEKEEYNALRLCSG